MAASTQMQEALRVALGPIVLQERRYWSDLLATGCWLGLLVCLLLSPRAEFSPGLRAVSLSLVLVLLGLFLRNRYFRAASRVDYRKLAQRVEAKNPHLHGLLITAVEQTPERPGGPLNFLQRRVMLQALEDGRRRAWTPTISGRWHSAVILLQWTAVLSFVALGSYFQHRTRSQPETSPLTAASAEVEVTPGDVTLERGSSLIITAKFGADLPGEATLQLEPRGGETQRIALQQSLNDPVFGGALPEVKTDLTYRVAYNGQQTRAYQVHVFDFPRLERADAQLHFPAYTKLPEKTFADTKRVAAVEGTKVDLQLQLNKPVRSAALVSKEGETIPLTIAAGEAKAELHGYQPVKSQTYELRLTDADGRASKVPATFAMEVLPNHPPQIKILAPKGDQRVSPLQEVAFQTEVWDDFGLPAYGITYTVAGGETKEVALGHDAVGEAKLRVEHLVKLEELGLKPDQLISWFAWAEDVGPDGKSRRVASDLYFAEVRPFEEIFRPGDAAESKQQQQAGGGAGAEAEKLGEVQKQIIAATWNLQRTEQARPVGATSGSYQKDVPVVLEAQKHAIELTQALRDKLEEPTPQGMAELAMSEMRKAVGELEKAVASAVPLPAALADEQNAYNALLKLAAHEFRVVRNQSQQQGKESQSRQQQLDQLEMKEEKDRYETQKEAAPQQKEEAREQLAILNRLKELAQRQHDINEKVKELQAALQEAKTEQQKEELKKELKRLQEEQQQMLAQVDDLQQKMQGQADPTRFAEERKQLEQSREEAQKTNEALRQEKAGEALAAGTRTERDLQKLRDDFRQKSSAQFNEQMRQMRTDARTLAADQQELTEKLEQEAQGAKPKTRPTLDGASPRDSLADRADKQQERLKGLQEEMKTVSEQAEAAEPLLAKELYDTLRKASQADTEETLRKTSLLAKRGYAAQAKQLNERAGQEIEEVKAGVERAAESVLGNEAEALRLARAELDALGQQLSQEIAAAVPQLAQAEAKAMTEKLTDERELSSSGAEKGAKSGASSEGGGSAKQPGDRAAAREPMVQSGNDTRSGSSAPRAVLAQGEQASGPAPAGANPRAGQMAAGASGEKPGAPDQPKSGGQLAGQPGQGALPGQGRRAGSGMNQPGESQPRAENGQPGEDQSGGSQPGQRLAFHNRQGNAQPGAQDGQAPGQEQQGQGQPREGQQGQQGQGRQGQGQQGGGEQGEGQQGKGQRMAQNGKAGQGGAPGGDQPGSQSGSEADGQAPAPGTGVGSPAASGGKSGQGGSSANAASATPDQSGQPGANLRQLAQNSRLQRGGVREGGGSGGGNQGGGAEQREGPIRGSNFAQWSDRLRNVEEMVDDPEVRSEVARIRQTAQAARADFKRHSEEPKWDMIQAQVARPLAQMRDRVAEELARRDSKESLVPIDRDPVPPKFAEQVQRYYEVLGSDAPRAPARQ